jgi:hypothetical protein
MQDFRVLKIQLAFKRDDIKLKLKLCEDIFNEIEETIKEIEAKEKQINDLYKSDKITK